MGRAASNVYGIVFYNMKFFLTRLASIMYSVMKKVMNREVAKKCKEREGVLWIFHIRSSLHVFAVQNVLFF